MNGMLLAAGRGERMEPLSSLLAKPALDVLGRPLLASAWDQLRAAGCDRVVVNLHRHPAQVRAAVSECHDVGARVSFSPEPVLLGSAGGIAAARGHFVRGAVLAANADVWSRLDLGPLLAAGSADAIVLGLIPNPNPQRWSSVVLATDGTVTAILPPGTDPTGQPFLFTGYQLLGENVPGRLPAPPAEIGPVWTSLLRDGLLRGVVLTGSWREAGSPEAYRRLVTDLAGEAGWVHSEAQLAAGVTVHGSAVGRRCRVAPGVTLRRSVITAGARVAGAGTLQRCIVAGDVEAVAPRRDSLVLPSGIFPLLAEER